MKVWQNAEFFKCVVPHNFGAAVADIIVEELQASMHVQVARCDKT
jgi:hypothetical protein